MKIFLSFSFNHGQDLTRAVERLLASHDVEIVTGRRLGGESVDDAVKAKILEADAVVSLLTRREKIKGGGWTTSQAVMEELDFAHNLKTLGRDTRAIALIEDGIKLESMAKHEHIPYVAQKRLEAILALSETLAKWRQEMGQDFKVQIMPVSLAEKLMSGTQLTCSHRLLDKDMLSPWKEITAIPEDECAFVYVRGVRAGQKIQLRVAENSRLWISTAKFPWPMIQLKENPNA